MENFMDARRIHWHDEMPETSVRDGFGRAAELNVDGWDGYYAEVAIQEGVGTILALDEDFDRLDDVSATVILSPEGFATLNEHLEN